MCSPWGLGCCHGSHRRLSGQYPSGSENNGLPGPQKLRTPWRPCYVSRSRKGSAIDYLLLVDLPSHVTHRLVVIWVLEDREGGVSMYGVTYLSPYLYPQTNVPLGYWRRVVRYLIPRVRPNTQTSGMMLPHSALTTALSAGRMQTTRGANETSRGAPATVICLCAAAISPPVPPATLLG